MKDWQKIIFKNSSVAWTVNKIFFWLLYRFHLKWQSYLMEGIPRRWKWWSPLAIYSAITKYIEVLKCVSCWINEFAKHLFMDNLWQNMDVIVWNIYLSYLKSHNQTFRHITTPKDTCKWSFFPHTIAQWHILPQTIISSPSIDFFREQLTPAVLLNI